MVRKFVIYLGMGKSARSNRKKRIRPPLPTMPHSFAQDLQKKSNILLFCQCPILSCFFMKNTTASISADFWRPHPPSKIWGEAVSLVKGIWGPPLPSSSLREQWIYCFLNKRLCCPPSQIKVFVPTNGKNCYQAPGYVQVK